MYRVTEKATIKGSTDSYVYTELDYHKICSTHSTLINIDGELTCDEKPLPKGSYTKTCENIRYIYGVHLNADCFNNTGTLLHTALNYGQDCAVNSWVSNINGQLRCDIPK